MNESPNEEPYTSVEMASVSFESQDELRALRATIIEPKTRWQKALIWIWGVPFFLLWFTAQFAWCAVILFFLILHVAQGIEARSNRRTRALLAYLDARETIRE